MGWGLPRDRPPLHGREGVSPFLSALFWGIVIGLVTIAFLALMASPGGVT
jgi:tetrahydromethanopterin S-methyltransferase subunit B